MCYQGFSTALERKTALSSSLLSFIEQEVTHLDSHGIPAVMLRKSRVDDQC